MSLAGDRNSHQDIRHLLEKATQMPSFCMRIKLFLHLPSQHSLWFCDLKDMVELERVYREVGDGRAILQEIIRKVGTFLFQEEKAGRNIINSCKVLIACRTFIWRYFFML